MIICAIIANYLYIVLLSCNLVFCSPKCTKTRQIEYRFQFPPLPPGKGDTLGPPFEGLGGVGTVSRRDGGGRGAYEGKGTEEREKMLMLRMSLVGGDGRR
jgi:hypothetical protein